MSSRRKFIQQLIWIACILPVINFLSSCRRLLTEKTVKGKIVGASASSGHILRDRKLNEPTEVEYKEYVIAGGGVSGLSAGKYFKDHNVTDFIILELENEVGGNSASGKNEVTSYPWGAHYLPLPNHSNQEILDFLKEHNIVTHVDEQGNPFYNEYYLCHDPEERLYIHGQWQNGLVPHLGLSARELNEIKRFLAEMDELRNRKGSDGKFAFDIPLDHSSQDKSFTDLDQLTMHDYLVKHGYKSEYLNWYVNYCCRDDYGTDLHHTSAWAGLHYFASRRGTAANAESSAVLTWPEGNAFLVNKLKSKLTDTIQSNCVVYAVTVDQDLVNVDYIEVKTRKLKRIKTKKCIVATPQFVTKRIVQNIPGRTEEAYKKFTYAPWMIANLTVATLKERLGRPLSWDNVFYGSKSLGFINATHQQLSRPSGDKVFTYYYPLTDKDPVQERMAAHQKTHEKWAALVQKDLQKAYPDIDIALRNMDVWIWGHGMIRPVPGLITGIERSAFKKSYDHKIFFAHSDLSGISIFEEAFYHGCRAAKEALTL